MSAIDDVLAERVRQDRKGYTAEHDDEHDLIEFLDFIEPRLERARNPLDTAAPLRRKMLVEIAALAIAAIEMLDRRNPAPAAPPEGTDAARLNTGEPT